MNEYAISDIIFDKIAPLTHLAITSRYNFSPEHLMLVRSFGNLNHFRSRIHKELSVLVAPKIPDVIETCVS